MLFQSGDLILHSGRRSRWKIDCDGLTAADWQTLALMVWELVGPFSSVVGVPRGGLPLAEALLPYRAEAGPHLIVDDVLTTGASLAEFRQACSAPQVIGAVVFARGRCPGWVRPLFQLSRDLWI